MARDSLPTSSQPGAPEVPKVGSTPQHPPAEPDLSQAVTRTDRHPESSLKQRVQAGSAHFEFGTLLEGVTSTAQPLATPTNAKTRPPLYRRWEFSALLVAIVGLIGFFAWVVVAGIQGHQTPER